MAVRVLRARRGTAAQRHRHRNPTARQPSPGVLGELDADIEESTIPYDVDLVDLRNADPVLIAEILREGIPWRE
jgi:hypothetical protein